MSGRAEGRKGGRFKRAIATVVTIATVATVGTVAAQDTTKVRADTSAPATPVVPAPPAPPVSPVDSLNLKPPVSPMGALWRSILLPGWGQAKLNRKLTGALFITWEGVTLGMSMKTSHELRYMERTNSGGLGAKRKERQDWLVLLAFNHLFAAIEAYVSAHLYDFPKDLEIRAAPVPGGVGATVSIPFRIP